MQYLKIDDLTVRYPFQNKDVLKGVNLDIEKGETVLILGPSGGGKSTLALALNGIIPKSMEAEVSGTVAIDGKDPISLSFSEICNHIGILFQDPDTQFCMLSVEDEILFGLENLHLSKEEMDVRLERSLQLVGLIDWKKAQIRELSGGMKQKLGLACLIAMDPEVFILDEPTANLDPASTEEIFDLMIKLSSELNKTLIFIEHKLDQLLPYLERVIVLGKTGEIIADDTPRTIFNHSFNELTEQGIWVPKICAYAKSLEQKGLQWETFPLSKKEWECEFEKRRLTLPEAIIEEKEAAAVSPNVNPRSSILHVDHVSYSYKNHHVLKDIDFSIQSGDFVAVLGPNGTGKSTLAQILIGLLKPRKGDIYFDDVSLQELKVHELMQKVGFVFQNPEHQFVCDTVEEELAYGLKILGLTKEEWQPRVNKLLEQFHLVEQRASNPFSLSQGQKRRLSVATMLTNDQKLLILDEPTFGQDYVNTEALMNLLTELNQNGKTIMMITHDMELVAKYANKILLLHEGKVVYQGDVLPFFEETELLVKTSIRTPISYSLQQWVKVYEEAKLLC
ncbi:ABC transporter ATP-binding protein [Alkalihalobacillus deserti]|uniref:ABC transporter ATP-binding protein n=1 Tax=Alkalihalobacillus deserti TaxID=2879466 RepID=UPI001D149DB4|nr:ABC transporter ATP-binding protein [Alkalihalobacillus deserti]